MGNTLLEGKESSSSAKQFDSWITQQKELLGIDNLLFENKIFKSYKYDIPNQKQSLILKIYFKEKTELDYDFYQRQIQFLAQEKFPPSKYCNLMPYMKTINLYNSDSENYDKNNKCEWVGVIRQRTASNLSDRFLDPPYLMENEKHWIIFQLIVALQQVHNNRMYHGNMKSSNVLLTTSNHVYLTDFGVYKPLYIKEDKISDYTIHFERDNRCYLAPEKFGEQLINNSDDLKNINEETLLKQQQMDIFSLGCIIQETYDFDQNFMFNYETIFQYRKKMYDPSVLIKRISNPHIQQLVLRMIDLDPAKRIKIDEILQYFTENVINKPLYSYMYHINQTLVSQLFSNPDLRIYLIQKSLPTLFKIIGSQMPQLRCSMPVIFQQIDILEHKDKILQTQAINIFKILGIEPLEFKNLEESDINNDNVQYENKSSVLKQENSKQDIDNLDQEEFEDTFIMKNIENIDNLQYFDFKSSYDNYQNYCEQIKTQNQQEKQINQDTHINQENIQNLDLKNIIRQICVNIRNTKYSASKLVGIELLEIFSYYIPDSENLHFILPYLNSQFQEQEHSDVVSAAYQSFVNIVYRLKDPFRSYSDTILFKEFIQDQFLNIYNLDNTQIYRTFAQNIGKMYESLYNLYQIIKIKGKEQLEKQKSDPTIKNKITEENIIKDEDEKQFYDKIFNFFLKFFRKLSDKSTKEGSVDILKITLNQMSTVFNVFRKIEENLNLKDSQILEIFSLLTSLFNNQDLLSTYIQCLPDIIQSLQFIKEVNYYFLSFTQIIEGYLYTTNFILIYQSIKFLKTLVQRNFFDKQKDIYLIDKISPMILYPHNWIRNEAISFIEVTFDKFSDLEIYTEIFPIMGKYVDPCIKILTKDILKMCLPEMIPRELFNFKSLIIQEYKKEFVSNIKLFKENYFKKISPQKNNQNIFQKSQNFKNQYDHINNNYSKFGVNLTKKINEYLSLMYKFNIEDQSNSIFKYNSSQSSDKVEQINTLFQYLKIQQLSLAEKKSPSYLNQHQISQIDQNLKTFYYKLHQILIEKSNDISIYRQRFLKLLHNEIFQQQYKMGLQVQANYNYKNLINSITQANSHLLKLKQFFIQEELEIGKPIQFSTSSNQSQVKNWRPQGQLVTTIYEHSDIVSCLEVMKHDRFILSGSYDGFVKIYDMNKIEQDLTSDSIGEVQCQDQSQNQYQPQKIKSLKMLQDSCSLLYGTDKGIIDIMRVDYMHSYLRQNYLTQDDFSYGQKRVQRYRFDGEIKAIQTFQNELKETCFMYCTSKGEVGIKDIRQKSSATVINIGAERGLISSLLLRPYSSGGLSAAIGTLNGYCLTYDIRCNMISNFAQLQDNNGVHLPITTMENFYNYVKVDTLNKQKQLVAIGYASNHNEVAFFNLDSTKDQESSIYMLSSKDAQEIYKTPQLVKMDEKNSTYTLRDMFNYDFIQDYTNQVDVLNYLKDPLIVKQNKFQDEWLDKSKNCYKNISNIYQKDNYPNKIICYPNYPSQDINIPKNQENYILTAGSDKNIRFTPLISDPIKTDPKHQSYVRGFHVCNIENQDKAFKQVKAGNDVNILHEFDKSTLTHPLQDHKKEDIPCSYNKMDKRSFHSDTIQDMALLQRPNTQLIVTASRDKTIKIWK